MSFRNLIIRFIVFVFMPGLMLPGSAQSDNAQSQIVRANDYYTNSQYKEAASIYQELVDRGNENGYLFYNLGNTYLRLGKTGPSILNYIRAQKLLPRDESLDANLRIAILKTQDQLEPPGRRGWSSVFFWMNTFTKTEQLIFLVIINLLFWIALFFWVIRKTMFWNLARKALMAFLVLSALSTGVKFHLESTTTLGVVLTQTIDVKSAQGVDNVTLFQLHEGSVVAILNSENNWIQIELNDGKRGWAPKQFIGT